MSPRRSDRSTWRSRWAAAALNFRDVMVTLGLLPSSSFERSALGRTVGLGGERGSCAAPAPTCAPASPATRSCSPRAAASATAPLPRTYLVFRKPEALSMEQAASVLSVYVTAYYSMIHLARLREGQRVLIHSAMGGVGQAAIALARHAGAEIYATAGSESKREQLRELGVQAAFDSHSLDWYDELLAATAGEGVDVVLNSLAGRHIALCLEALRPGGWHCEIGKVDIYADNALSLSVFRKNLRFAAIDVDRLMNDDPYLTRELSQECLDLLDRGRGAAAADHHLPLPRLRRAAAPDDHRPAHRQAGPEGPVGHRRRAAAGRRPAPLPRSRGDLPGNRRLRRLRPPAAALSGHGRRTPHHPAGPRSAAPPQRRLAAQDQCPVVPLRRHRNRHRGRRRRRGSGRSALHRRPAAAPEGRVPPGRQPWTTACWPT